MLYGYLIRMSFLYNYRNSSESFVMFVKIDGGYLGFRMFVIVDRLFLEWKCLCDL